LFGSPAVSVVVPVAHSALPLVVAANSGAVIVAENSALAAASMADFVPVAASVADSGLVVVAVA
jgi:hypothetical protein